MKQKKSPSNWEHVRLFVFGYEIKGIKSINFIGNSTSNRHKAPNRYSKEREHNIYGIKNWFRTKGITDEEVMKEVIYAFCEKRQFEMDKINILPAVSKFIQNRFTDFGAFGMNYMRQNNYIHDINTTADTDNVVS